MTRLKQAIVEIHRRSLWQVLMVYLGACWAVLEASDQVIERYLLPVWVYPTEIIVLLVGLPIVLGTAMVREETSKPAAPATSAGDAGGAAGSKVARPDPRPKPSARYLTWPRAVAIVLGALAIVGVASAFVVYRGSGRVTESSGTAGDAFAERAWLVIAELESADDERDVALAVRELLAVDLQQSSYVNVYNREQLAPVLARMGLPDTARVDRELALEVAEREGLAAVLAATVTRLGGDYAFSARVIQPVSGQDLIAVRAAASEDRLADGVETLSREIRRRLGEARQEIRQSEPLPRVTTRSLEALRAYAQAASANDRREYEQALDFAKEAIRLDSTFALAYQAAGALNRNLSRWGEAVPYARRAYELRDNLTARERLQVEAYYHWSVELDPRRAAEMYERLLAQYPDDYTAASNFALMAEYLGEWERAYRAALRAVEIEPYRPTGYAHAILTARWTNRWPVADSMIALAAERGFASQAAAWSQSEAIGLRDWDRADFLCDSLLAVATSPAWAMSYRNACGSLDIARGRIESGIERRLTVARYYASRRSYVGYGAALAGPVMGEAMRGREAAARAHWKDALAFADPAALPAPERYLLGTTAQVVPYLLGWPDLAEDAGARYPSYPDSSHPIRMYGDRLVRAARALSDGEAERAVESLRGAQTESFRPGSWELHKDLMLAEAYEQLGQADSAVKYLEAVIEPARLAEGFISLLSLPGIERRLAELEAARGNVSAAVQHYQNFLALWSDPDPELRPQIESARRALDRLMADR
jgi:tetratricopeptide (TPR) repeat protein